MTSISDKRKIFCNEYIIDFNGAAAAERAGYSKRRARQTASELLADPTISEEISKLINEREKKLELTSYDVVNELKAIAFSKNSDFVKVKDVVIREGKKKRKIRAVLVELTSDVEEEKQKAIAEVSQTKDGIRIKSHDKVKALQLLGMHLGIFEKDNNQKKTEVVIPAITHNINFKKCDGKK